MAQRTPKGLPGILAGVAVLALAAFGGSSLIDAPGNATGDAPGEVPACASLPAEAWDTIDSVEQGGPYRYPEDDSRFGNYQGELPDEKLGYYREYTVGTPGLGHRGERRIVTGGGADGVVDEWYYTGDHYESFCEVPR